MIADSALENTQTAARFIELLEANPASRNAYRMLLERAREQIDRTCLAEWLDTEPTPAAFIQTSQNAISTLVSKRVLAQTILINGNPYEGDAQALMDDDGIADDDEITYLVQITPAGQIVLDQTAPSQSIAELFERKPQHRAAFLKVLDACAAQAGASARALEDLFKDDRDALKYSEHANRPTVYPAYFTGALEAAGAIAWDAAASVWRTTLAGRAAQ